MLGKLKALFTDTANHQHNRDPRALQLAAAALLIELSRADFRRDPREQQAIVDAIRTTFNLDVDTVHELLSDAETANAQATSLYEFTYVLNEQCDDDEKYALVRELWRVAFADGNIDKYEDHLIRQIADLIYLPHTLYIKAKMEAASIKSS